MNRLEKISNRKRIRALGKEFGNSERSWEEVALEMKKRYNMNLSVESCRQLGCIAMKKIKRKLKGWEDEMTNKGFREELKSEYI